MILDMADIFNKIVNTRYSHSEILVDLYNIEDAPIKYSYKLTECGTKQMVDSKGNSYNILRTRSVEGIKCMNNEVITLRETTGMESRFIVVNFNCSELIKKFIHYIVVNRLKSPFKSNDIKRLKELEHSFLIRERRNIELEYERIAQKEISDATKRAAERNLVLERIKSLE